jgi:hypothetical protein
LFITTTGGIVQPPRQELSTRISTGQNASSIGAIMPSTGKLLKLDIGVTTGLYEPPTRILVVCSSHTRGVYLSEFAEPFNILREKFDGKERLEFVIASPKGGPVSLVHECTRRF